MISVDTTCASSSTTRLAKISGATLKDNMKCVSIITPSFLLSFIHIYVLTPFFKLDVADVNVKTGGSRVGGPDLCVKADGNRKQGTQVFT